MYITAMKIRFGCTGDTQKQNRKNKMYYILFKNESKNVTNFNKTPKSI